MKPFHISMVSFSFFFNLLFLSAWATFDSTNIAPFLECLNTNSDPSKPIFETLYFPTNSSYSYILKFYMRNLRYNESATPKPQLILTALHVSHIQFAVICAKSHGLEMRIRSGGHDFEGVSYVSDEPFFILDLFNLRTINVNVGDETAWIEAGATLGEVYYRIAEKSSIHAFPGGMCPTVGAGGQISGGGFGNLIRKYGLAADNVIDATLVDANGRLLDRASMGEDLFWAITGGGASSFGVVVAYKIRLVKVPPVVTFAGIQMTYNMQNFTNIVYKYLQVVDKLDKDIYIKLAINVVRDGQIKIITGTFLTLFLGDSDRLVGLMTDSFPEIGLTKADCVEVSWVESLLRWTNFPTGTPTSILLSRVHPAPVRMKRKSVFLKNPIPRKGLEFIFKKMEELETPILKFFPYGGIMNDISPSAKPFPHRAGNIALVEIATNWNETGAEAADYYIDLTRKLYAYITPFVSKSREAYLNYRDLDLGINNHGPNSYSEAAGYGLKYFKNNFDKLVQIKAVVDPENFLRNEQSIPIFRFIGSELTSSTRTYQISSLESRNQYSASDETTLIC